MNKTLLPKNKTFSRIFVMLTLCTLMGLMTVQSAKADPAPPPDPKLGGVVPYQPLKTNVQMMSETVFMDILPPPPEDANKPKQIKVNASFTMRNQGQAEEQMQVIFPLSSLDNPYADPSEYQIDSSSFVAKVDGKPVSISEITTPAEVSAFMDKENNLAGYFQIRWAAFEVTFPVQQDVLLEVQYDMFDWYQMNGYQLYGTYGFDGIDYILETGAGWYGNIVSAEIILRFPYPASEEVVSRANPGYIFSGNEMRWQFRDFEPTRDDNLELRLFRVDVWQTILKLRSQAEQNPKDTDVWVDLGNRYIDYAVAARDGYIYVISPHFVELAVEARQKVLELHPDWGDAHYKLAESLWFNIPGVQNRQRITADVHLNDPAVQRVFRELEQAWLYAAEVNEYDAFIDDIGRTFPELRLQPPVITTVTISPPTQTLAPNATDTALPTASPALIVTISPTPIPPETASGTSYRVAILILGVALTLGIFTYRWSSKSRAVK